MFPDLPEHLQTLNTVVSSPPSSVMNQEYEDAVWNYLNTDDLFSNFGTQPTETKEPAAPADLKSFIAQFALEGTLPLPTPYNATASTSTAPTPLTGVNTWDIMPPYSAGWPSEDGRMSGVKKLKQLGAGVVEIEDE